MEFSQLKQGDSEILRGFSRSIEAPYRSKLLAMGLIPGTSFKVLHIAPLGDPIAIEVRGSTISLRKQDAANLLLGAPN